jgi:glycine cleavage system H protein
MRRTEFTDLFLYLKINKMDGFSYSNIFDTKGIEYIAIIAFFLILIPFWILLNKKVKISNQFRRLIGIFSPNSIKVPQGIFFSKNHTWTHLGKSGSAAVGLDDLLMHITGTVKFNMLRNPGEKISQGDLLAEIHQDGKTLKIFSPISGKIIKANNLIKTEPQLSYEDPYGNGWIYRIKPTNWIAETGEFYLAENAIQWSNTEFHRFKDFLTLRTEKFSDNPSFQVLMDGGELCDNLLAEMPDEIWKDFQQEFLDHSGGQNRPSVN